MRKNTFRMLIPFLLIFGLTPFPCPGENASSALLRSAKQELLLKKDDPSSERSPAFKGAVLSTSLKADKSFKDEEGALRLKSDAGLQLKFKNTSLFVGGGLPRLTGEEYRETFKGGLESVKENAVTRWGVQAESPESYPFSLKVAAGTLSFSHALSIMKNPLLSSGSSLRALSLSKGDIAFSMPTLLSSKKEEALFASVCKSGGRFRPGIFAMGSGDSTYALSADFPFDFARGCLFQAAFAGAVFSNKREASSSWFSKNLPYKEAEYAASCAVVNLKLPFAKSSSVFGVNQNPFGGLYRYFRTQDGLDLPSPLGLTSLSLGLFTSDSDLLTASGTRISWNRQFHAGASHSFYARDSLFRLGASFRRSEKDESLSSPEQKRDLLRADVSFNRGLFSLSSYASAEFEEGGDRVYRASLTWKENFPLLRSSATLSARHAGEKDSLSLKVAFRPELSDRDFSVNIGAGANANIIEGKFMPCKIDSSVAFTFKRKLLSVNAKIAFSAQIQ